MNVTALSNGSALSRMSSESEGGAFGQVGTVIRPAAFAPVVPNDRLRAVSANRIPPPGEGGRIERPRTLAADRMEQLQADIPQDGAMTGVLAMFIKFNDAQRNAH